MALRCKIGVVGRWLGKRRRCRWERCRRWSPWWACWERCRCRWRRRYPGRAPKRSMGRHCIVHRATEHRYCLVPAMLMTRRCARAIRLGRRDCVHVRAELGYQILGRHDVDGGHEIIGQNKLDRPTESCGEVQRRYEGDVRSERCET